MASRASKVSPIRQLAQNRKEALKLAQRKGVAQTMRMLKRAQTDLDARLRQAEGLGGPGPESFTASQLRSALAQIRQVVRDIKREMRTNIVDAGIESAQINASNTAAYILSANQKFSASPDRLQFRQTTVLDRAVKGTRSSILHRISTDPKHPGKLGVLDRYGAAVIKRFEETLQNRFLAKSTWGDVRNQLIADSEFLQGAPASWAERIARTEVMSASNRANWETMREVNREVGGGMLKILAATFDSRTAADSFAVHGQIRRIDEAFEDWYHMYQTPPNRPNDREVVVPHNMAWPIPPDLEWRTDDEVAERWTMEGRKGSPPPRPIMTTVELDKIGTTA